MKFLLSAYLWVQESTLRTFVGLIVIITITSFVIRISHAATSYDVSNEVQMYLDASITTTQTTGITLSAPQLNGSDFTFATTTGGILRIRSGSYREDIYYTSATVDATTKKVTLVTPIRNICPQHPRVFATCGNGRSWARGSIVELTVDARLLNLKANVDRTNTFIATQTFGSGANITSYDDPLRLVPITTAQRDALTAQEGDIIANSTTNTFQMYIGGSWSDVGTSTTSNATEAAAGKVELATIKQQSGAVALDEVTSSPLVVQTRYLTSSGGIAAYEGRIPILGNLGILSGRTLSTNYAAAISSFGATGSFLRIDGQYAEPENIATWRLACRTATGSSTIANTTTLDVYYDTTCHIPASLMTTGAILRVTAGGEWFHGNLASLAEEESKIALHFNNTKIGRWRWLDQQLTEPNDFAMSTMIHIRRYGDTGQLQTTGALTGSGIMKTASSVFTPSIDTNAATGAIIKISATKQASDAAYNTYLTNFMVEVLKQ